MIVAVQVVAVDSKPDPVYEKTVLMVPVDGVTVTLAVTLNTALAKSFAGDPTTRIVQFMS